MPQAATIGYTDNGPDVTFTVEFTPHGKYKNRYDVWIRFDGLDEKGERTANNLEAIQSAEWDGDTGTHTMVKPGAAPGNNPVVSYRAFAWYFPDPDTPISNTVTLP